MDILFVNSINFDINSKSVPLGLLNLATILKNNGYSADIVDFDYLIEDKIIELNENLDSVISQMSDYILEKHAKIISFYTMCNSYPITLKLAQYIKSLNSDIKILLGGPQATFTSEATLKMFNFIDAIGLEEGENTIIPIVKNLLSGIPLDNTNGVAFRKGSNVYINRNLEIVDKLDSIPYIDVSFLDYYYARNNRKKSNKDIVFNLDVGRGCTFSCTFCCTSIFWERRFRLKSSQRLVDEIKRVKDRYGIIKFAFQHDLFTANKNRIIDFCKLLIKENVNIKWGCSARIDTLDEELISIMQEAGCDNIYIGIETGSGRMQKIINKNLPLDNIVEKIDLIKKYGIKVTTSFIYGFYEETICDLKETLYLMVKLMKIGCNIIQLHRFIALPGTKETEKVKDKLFYTNDMANFAPTESRYIESLSEIIKSNSEIFSNFYEFNSDLRIYTFGLDLFFNLIYFIYIRYANTFCILMDSFNDDLFTMFTNYKALINKMRKEILAQQYNQISITQIIFSVYRKYAEIIVNDVCRREKNKILMSLYDFEKCIDAFYNKRDDKEIIDFPINVIKLSKNRNISFSEINEQITVLFLKSGDKRIKIKRIA